MFYCPCGLTCSLSISRPLCTDLQPLVKGCRYYFLDAGMKFCMNVLVVNGDDTLQPWRFAYAKGLMQLTVHAR